MRLRFVNSCTVLLIHFLVCECLEQAICCLFHVYRVQEKQIVAISGSPAVILRCPYSNLSISLYSIVQEAYPGDVIGINNPGHFAIGDTIFTGSTKVRFPGIPSFSPECFAYMRNPNPSKYKNYRKGLDQVNFETLFSDYARECALPCTFISVMLRIACIMPVLVFPRRVFGAFYCC